MDGGERAREDVKSRRIVERKKMEEGGQSEEDKDKDMSGASCVTHIIQGSGLLTAKPTPVCTMY